MKIHSIAVAVIIFASSVVSMLKRIGRRVVTVWLVLIQYAVQPARIIIVASTGIFIAAKARFRDFIYIYYTGNVGLWEIFWKKICAPVRPSREEG